MRYVDGSGRLRGQDALRPYRRPRRECTKANQLQGKLAQATDIAEINYSSRHENTTTSNAINASVTEVNYLSRNENTTTSNATNATVSEATSSIDAHRRAPRE